jgi:phage-related baseplate assembly protein
MRAENAFALRKHFQRAFEKFSFAERSEAGEFPT